MASKRKQNFLVQGTILAVAGILVRLIGMVYRIPMANILGEDGNGIYSVAFGIYNIALTLSSYALPLALSRLVSQRIVQKQYRNAHNVFQKTLLLGLATSTAVSLVLYFGAGWLENLYARGGLAAPLRVLAVTTFIMSMVGTLRGFFQGRGTMMPTALSQIFEQIVNAVVSVWAAYAFVTSSPSLSQTASRGAAGGTVGTLAGAATALLLLVVVYALYRPTVMRQIRRDRTEVEESGGQVFRILLLTILPVILSQTVYQLGNTADDLIFGNIMQAKGMAATAVSSLQGVFNSQYVLLINVPVAIASAMAASVIPSIVASQTLGDHREVCRKADSVIKFNTVIVLPCAVGLAVLARPIITLLFPSLVTYRDLAVHLLEVGSSAAVFYVLSTITSAILQGLGFMRTPVKHSAIALAIHLVLILGLLWFTDLGVYALVIGNITFPMTTCLLNWRFLRARLPHRQNLKKIFLVPLLSSALMGLVAWGGYHLLHLLVKSNLVCTLVAILLAVGCYFVLVLALRCFSKKELYELPLGRTIATLAGRLGLLK